MVKNKTWNEVELPEILKGGKNGIKMGPFGSQLKKEFLMSNGQYRVYGQENVYANDFSIGKRYIEKEKYLQLKSCEVLPGDFLISSMGTIGKCAIAPSNIPKGIMDSHLIRLRLNKTVIKENYLKYYIQSSIVQKQIKDLSVGGIMDGLSTSIIKKLIVIISPVKEQEAIEKVLSDIENLINNLEKLIIKKKDIKQGTMQELLTGKKRLNGFSEEWVKINLASKSKLKARIGWQGLTTSEYLSEGYAYLITGTDFLEGQIDWRNCHFVNKSRYEQDKNIQVANGDILVTKDGTIGKVAIVNGLVRPATLNSGVFVIRPIKSAYNTQFVYHILSSNIFIDFLKKLSAGSTINHLYQKDFVNFDFMIPADKKEQEAIAEVLTDMDIEIQALEKKLFKVKQIKKGMMDELLTGRIRLIDNVQNTISEKVSKHSHNKHFDDAVAIAGIVNSFYSEKYSLGRKKIQKLLYLMRRKEEENIKAFKKKAAGPYADEIRYKGGEPIAITNKYIITKRSDKGTSFTKGQNIDKALGYIEKWGIKSDIQWLIDNFKYTKTNILELLATVDMAICDLVHKEINISIASIKHLIETNDEWKAKLDKDYFSDENIAYAIEQLTNLLQYEEVNNVYCR